MGRGGGGGGGRSSSSGSRGGSRSSGGHHGGSSSHRGGYSGGGSRSRSSFGPSMSRHYGPSYHRTTVYAGGPGYYRRGSVFGLLNSIVTIVIMLVVILSIVGVVKQSSGNIMPSTIDRTPLDKQYVTLTGDWYRDDNGDWISDKVTLERGMRKFYEQTGVAPYLYLTETVNGSTRPTEREMDEFANKLYDQLFADEGHLLVIFQEYNSDGQYYSYYLAGKMAKTVMDDEAGEILLDYIDHYYYSDLTEDELFAKAFSESGERMMHRTKSLGERIMMPVLGIVILVVILLILKSVFKRQKERAAETERILNTPVEHISSSGGDLEDKYL